MTTAASVAEIHLAPINASRKKCGLPALTAAEVELEFADVNRFPARTKAVATRTTPNTGAADSMWGGIVARLNKTVPASRTPIAAGRTSPESSDGDGRVDAAVDWSSIASALNREAGVARPGRSAR
jgi:hypothetical protein